MSQDEQKKHRNKSVAKLQAIKEVTKRVMELDEEESHSLILIETLDEGDGFSSQARMLLDGDIHQAIPLLNCLLQTASDIISELPDGFIEHIKETRKLDALALFLRSAEVGSELMKWTDIGEE
jgi:hypothetical protein